MWEKSTGFDTLVYLLLTVLLLVMCVVFPTGTEAARADGLDWYQVLPPPTDQDLYGVSMLDSGSGWAVGKDGTILQYNGYLWLTYPHKIDRKFHSYGVSALDKRNAWAVGGWTKDIYKWFLGGNVIHWNGRHWREQFVDEMHYFHFNDVVAIAKDNVYAGGYRTEVLKKGGYIYHYDGKSWTREVGPIGGSVNSIAGIGPHNVWTADSNGWVYQHNENRWIAHNIKGGNLQGVAVAGNIVVAVGEKGVVNYSTDGQNWNKETIDGKPHLYDVTLLDDGKCWAVGKKGAIYYNEDITDTNQDWTQQDTTVTEDLRGVQALDANTAWAVGNKGTILKYVGPTRIVGCDTPTLVQGQNYNVKITGANTHFEPGHSSADFGQGIKVHETYVKPYDYTHATAKITVDSNATPGLRDVNVVTKGLTIETPEPLKGGTTVFEAPHEPPHLDNLEPTHGTAGANVTLAGKYFGASRGSSFVTINNKKVNRYNSWADGTIACKVPSGATSGPVLVTTQYGVSNAMDFTVDEPHVPTITVCYPNYITQGDSIGVSIYGDYTHFEQGISQAVFSPQDGITVTGTNVIDSHTTTAFITADYYATTGPRSVNVVTGDETPTPLDGCFTVVPRMGTWPVLDSLSATRGSPGDKINLYGENFIPEQGPSYVTFGNTNATDYISWSDTQIECTIPDGVTTGPVTVTTTAGTSGGISFNVGDSYIKDCQPTDVVQGHEISSFYILGDYTHFEQGESKTTTSGGGMDVGPTSVSDSTHATTNLKVDTNATPGTREVNVITDGETPAPLKNVFTIHEAPSSPPVIDGLDPGAGSAGTTVSLIGKNFGVARGSSTVTFNGTPANTYLTWSDYEITCKTPLEAAPGMVEVVTPWGTSNQLFFRVSSPTFYFTEGTTRPGFEPYLSIQNPGDEDADVKITYMNGEGETDELEIQVGKHSRSTVTVKDTLGEGDDPAHDFSAEVTSTNGVQIVVERPQYFNYHGWATGGHDAVGALSPEPALYFAEGTCRTGFDPYITMQNPNGIDADVKITYMKGDGTTAEQGLPVPAYSRVTARVIDTLGEGEGPAHDFAAGVESTNGQTILVERPQYFNFKGQIAGGSDSVGFRIIAPATAFYFAEGTSRPGFYPYTCVQNPTPFEAEVLITYMMGGGTNREQAMTVPAHSRSTVSAKDFLGEGDNPSFDFSMKVESINGINIVCERPQFFNYHGEWPGGNTVVGTLAQSSTYYFAEGSCRPGFEPYISIQNPEIAHAGVKVTYMLGDGTVKEESIGVPACSRRTVNVKDALGENDNADHDFSCKVESTNGVNIVCERPMYFYYNGVWPGGHDAVGFTP